MTVQEEMEAITAAARSYQWTPELFERVRAILPHVSIFNVLYGELLPDEYDQFDLEYCSYFRPQDRELTKWLTEERKVKEWKKKERGLTPEEKAAAIAEIDRELEELEARNTGRRTEALQGSFTLALWSSFHSGRRELFCQKNRNGLCPRGYTAKNLPASREN